MSENSPKATGMSDAEIDAIFAEIRDPDPEWQDWLVSSSVSARLSNARANCCKRMAHLTLLYERQTAGEFVDPTDLENIVYCLRRDIAGIEHLVRIEAMGDFGRWLMFFQSDTYCLVSADRHHSIELPQTVDREGVMLAIRIAEDAYALGVQHAPHTLQAA